MGKIRVYELAKEAGMDSKVLTAKLIEMGYSVKSYSSTLDEATADEVRKKLSAEKRSEAAEEPAPVEVQTTTTETTEEKRIQRKGQTTIIRRRARAAVPEEEAEAEAPAAAPEEAPAAEAAAAEEAEAPMAAEAAEEAEAIEAPAAPEEAEAPTEVEAEAEEPVAAEAEEAPAAAAEEAEAAPAEEEEAEAAKPVQPKPRKGLARVIKKAAIPVSQIEEPPPARAAKAEKPKRKPAAEAAAGEAGREEAKKGKKGKRFVQFRTEPGGPRERGRKATAKRQGPVEIDAEEVQELGGRVPAAGIKIGRGRRGGGKKKKQAAMPSAETRAIKKRIKVYETISVGDFAHRMGVKASEVIAKLIGLGVMATVNQALDVDTATLVATDFGYEVEQAMTEELSILSLEDQEAGGEPKPRPPVVTVMGHVDHGKTSILDAIRKTDVAAGEAGGITQHIGAHYVRSGKGDVVFLDTPGHAAFTEMRSRGAKVTDVVVLVVAADDGVMDQTKEAISHARAAGVPIVVAVNKIDKPDAQPDRVKRELAELNLVPEEWGGDTIYCETSAKQGTGIEELLEQILLQAEILELKADPARKARGYVVEAQLHKGRGALATVLIQHGTLRVGDPFVVGQHYGRVRSLLSDKGEAVEEAGPSMPVEVQGLSGVPQAGDEFIVVTDEKMAKNISAQRQMKARENELAASSKISLDNLFERMREAETKELRVVLRADVQGTLEAFGDAITKLSTDEIKVNILHQGTGTIIESDVLLAAASDALIIGFNVRPNVKVQEIAKKEKVDMRFYDVIYHALDDIRNAMVGMLEPTYEEEVIGSVEVRDTFHVPKVGTIAGSYVTSGRVERNANVRVIRDGVVIYNGKLSSLKRFKDDVKEVQSGYECGIGVENYNDIKVGDVFEIYVMKEVAAEL